MAFKPTLVAPAELPAASPWFGHPITEVVLEQPNGENAGIPAGIAYDDRSRVSENPVGGDVRIDRRKVVSVGFTIDFIDADTKAALEKLYFDARDVYLCPNFGPNTRVSIPLQRSINDFVGTKTMQFVRAGRDYFWSDEDQIMRGWDNNEPALCFGGVWPRFLKTYNGGDNRVTHAHPSNSGHGWTVGSGTATLTYTEEFETPVVRQKTIALASGVLYVRAAGGGSAVTIEHASTSAFSTVNNIVASVLIKAQGNLLVSLEDVGTATVYDSVPITANGKWQLVRLSGANSNATSDAKIKITFIDTASGRTQTALIAPSYIATESTALGGEAPVADWHDGTAAAGQLTDNDAVDLLSPQYTISCFVKHCEARAGFFQIGNTPTIAMRKTGADGLELTYPDGAGGNATQTLASFSTAAGLSEGEWYHLCLTQDGSSLRVYVNGAAVISVSNIENDTVSDFLRLGDVFGDNHLDESGLSHFRIDHVAWSASEIRDHIDTYFKSKGRGVIEPAFGRLGYVSELNFDGVRLGSGNEQWVGSLVWTELSADEDFATVLRQEGDV